MREVPTLALAAMCLLALTVVCALVGGLWPALTRAVAGALLLNWFFTPPHHTLTIADPVNLGALVLFVLVATSVASVVDKAARRSIQANRAQHEADTLTMLNRTLLSGDQDRQALLQLVTTTFGLDAAALLRHLDDGSWHSIAAVGADPPADADQASDTAEVSSSLVLALRGPMLAAHEHTVLSAFATHLAVLLDRQEMARHVGTTQKLEAGNRVRTALLAAVSHDLRTPLAGVKAAVSSLRSPDVQWSPTDEAELLAAIEDSADRLHSIVANLLDLSRLQTDTVQVTTRQIGLEDVVSQTIANLPQAAGVELRLPADLPPVQADAGLLDRIVDNLVQNALHHSPADQPVRVTTSQVGDRVQLHVVDHGPGVADAEKERMFEPFQRRQPGPGRRGPRARRGQGFHRGTGRPAHRGEHPRRWADDGGGPARGRRRPAHRVTSCEAGMTTILLVDDDTAMLRTLSLNLRARGYDVRTAENGTQATAATRDADPDVVILDLGLPTSPVSRCCGSCARGARSR